MKNALILHGSFGNSRENWFPWLKKELENRGYRVWVPDLPDADFPECKKWLNHIFSNKEWKFDEDSIIVGHSAGGTLVVRLLEKLPEGIQINKAIIVAGCVTMGNNEELFRYKKNWVEGGYNWEKIKNSCKKLYLFFSDKDPYSCGIEEGREMKKHMGGELFFRPGQGHFNLATDPKYKEFPEVLEKIIE